MTQAFDLRGNPVDVYVTLMRNAGYVFSPEDDERLAVARAFCEAPVEPPVPPDPATGAGVMEALYADPEVWATHGAPSGHKAAKIEAAIDRAIALAVRAVREGK